MADTREPASENPSGSGRDECRAAEPGSAPHRTETSESCQLDAPRHESTDVAAEHRDAVGLEICLA